jgi:hypothetical protein
VEYLFSVSARYLVLDKYSKVKSALAYGICLVNPTGFKLFKSIVLIVSISSFVKNMDGD